MPELAVDLPGGGRLAVNSPEEVDMWDNSAQRYIEDYALSKQNDLVLLGAVLTQGLVMFRAQQDLADPKKASSAQSQVIKAADQIRELEKALGIDRKAREAGGQHTVANYISTLKKAAHEKGVHLSHMHKAYEEFAMEMRWRVRLLRNGDQEDRHVHGLSETAIVNFAEEHLAKLEEQDKKWAVEKGRVFVGRL